MHGFICQRQQGRGVDEVQLLALGANMDSVLAWMCSPARLLSMHSAGRAWGIVPSPV